MASEYLKQKALSEIAAEEPKEAQRPRSRKERILNWLHYHKWYLLAGAAVLWVIGTMLWNVLGIGKIEPDYTVAYVGGRALTEENAAGLQTAFETLGEDVNGDGRVSVELRQYVLNSTGDPETAMYYNYAADTLLLADITAGDSYFFLTDDPQGLQKAYQILANADGTPPAETDFDASNKVVPLESCPALADLTQDGALRGLSLGRRCFYDEAADRQSGNEALWQRLTKGAVQ